MNKKFAILAYYGTEIGWLYLTQAGNEPKTWLTHTDATIYASQLYRGQAQFEIVDITAGIPDLSDVLEGRV